MIAGEEWLLIGAVAGVGVLHTIVPDHWVPITLLARQQGWTKREVARAALVAGTGHTVSTLAIALVVWIAGLTFATKFGNLVSIVASIALISFGAWTALSALREFRGGAENGHEHQNGHGHHHGHEHHHEHEHLHDLAPDASGRSNKTELHAHAYAGEARTLRESGADARASEHATFAGNPAGIALRKHAHPHRHDGRSPAHVHTHVHTPDTWHRAGAEAALDPPLHEHPHERSFRTTLLLILGSSPMVEGIPAFFAAAKFGAGLLVVMALVFALSTIATYVSLCVTSVAGLQQVSLGPFERYGEVLSGSFIAMVGLVFLIFPQL